jgi:hypothetical protein
MAFGQVGKKTYNIFNMIQICNLDELNFGEGPDNKHVINLGQLL